MGMCLRQTGIDCNIILERSSFSRPLVNVFLGFILRLIFELVNFNHLLSFHLFVGSTTISKILPPPISSFSYRRSLIPLNSSTSEATRILLLDHFWLLFPLRSAGSSFVMERCQWTFLKNRLSTTSSSNLLNFLMQFS